MPEIAGRRGERSEERRAKGKAKAEEVRGVSMRILRQENFQWR
jgi:hypothetical protein